MTEQLKKEIYDLLSIDNLSEKTKNLNSLREFIHGLSPFKKVIIYVCDHNKY